MSTHNICLFGEIEKMFSLNTPLLCTMYMFLCWGLMTRQPLWVILCHLSEKGRKDIEEEMKERDRGERGTGMKVKKQKK